MVGLQFTGVDSRGPKRINIGRRNRRQRDKYISDFRVDAVLPMPGVWRGEKRYRGLKYCGNHFVPGTEDRPAEMERAAPAAGSRRSTVEVYLFQLHDRLISRVRRAD